MSNFKLWIESEEIYRTGYWLTIGYKEYAKLPDRDPDAVDYSGLEDDDDIFQPLQIRYANKQFADIQHALAAFQKELNSLVKFEDNPPIRIILSYYGGSINHVTDIVYWNRRVSYGKFGELVWNPKFKKYSNYLKEPKVQPSPDMYDKFINYKQQANQADNYQGKTYIK